MKQNILCLFTCAIYHIITKIQPKKGEMLLLSRLLSVVVDVILFYVFFQTNNYTIMKKINPLKMEKTKQTYHIYLTFEPTQYTSRQLSPMSHRTILSLVTLPVEIIYRILDHQDNFTIICSMRNVSQRLNKIVDSYHRYQVNFFFYFKCLIFIHLHNIIHFHNI